MPKAERVSKESSAKNPFHPPRVWTRPDVIAASLGINLLSVALPIVVLQVYDRFIPNQSESTFTLLIIGMVGVVLLDALLKIMRSIIMSWSGARFQHRESMRMLGHLMAADTLCFEATTPGNHLNRIQSLDKIQDFFSGPSMLLVVDLPFVLVFIALIWVIAGQMALVPIVLLMIFLLLSMTTGRSLRAALAARSQSDGRRQNFIIETLQGIHTIKSMAMEELMMRRYERLQLQSAESVYALARINGLAQTVGATFSQAATVVFVVVGSLLVVGGELTIGALAAGTMLSGRTLQPGLRAMGLWAHFQSVRLAKDDAERLVNLPTERACGNTLEPSLDVPIRIENVSFRFPGDSRDLLHNLNLTIQPGEAVGISGANGAGKSTLLALLMGFFECNEGRILYGDHDVQTINADYLHRNAGFMPQKGMLFEGTILENMTLFREGANTVEHAVDLTCELGLDDIIARLPAGLDTKIGTSAVDKLPEGIRQAIIMIRALVGEPPIIFFDDANANFDVRNDILLQNLIASRKRLRTMVIVSQRPSMLGLCDRQYSLENGRLIQRNAEQASARPTVANTA